MQRKKSLLLSTKDWWILSTVTIFNFFCGKKRSQFKCCFSYAKDMYESFFLSLSPFPLAHSLAISCYKLLFAVLTVLNLLFFLARCNCNNLQLAKLHLSSSIFHLLFTLFLSLSSNPSPLVKKSS